MLPERIGSRAAMAGLCLAISFSATAQTYDAFTLGAGFTPDPMTGSGSTGGPRDAAAVFGSGCAGQVANTPDHVINVTSTVNLRSYVTSTTDATLVIRGPAGTFCDDDSHGNLDPEINAVLTPGRYEVYVGHIRQQGSYTLTLTENFGGGNDPGSRRDFTLGAGFTPDPQHGSGRTGGSMDAGRFGRTCVGNIHTSPDHTITVTSTLDLHLYVDSTVDASLVIAGPNGVNFCDDDSHGNLDPAIRQRFQPGVYQVYIGHLGDTAGSYTLTITEDL